MKIDKARSVRGIERYFKGAANHWRLRILLLLEESPSLTLLDITEQVGGNLKTISEHTKKLLQADLIFKKYKGRTVLHNLTPHGEHFVRFIRTL